MYGRFQIKTESGLVISTRECFEDAMTVAICRHDSLGSRVTITDRADQQVIFDTNKHCTKV